LTIRKDFDKIVVAAEVPVFRKPAANENPDNASLGMNSFSFKSEIET